MDYSKKNELLFNDRGQEVAKISMGPSFLKPEEEKEHYGLYRPIIVDRRNPKTGKMERTTADPPVGPLMIFRIARADETVDMWTYDSTSQTELKLTKVWDGRSGHVIK